MSQNDGGIAQLGEHLPCKQGVIGSIPIISTILSKASSLDRSILQLRSVSIRSCKRLEDLHLEN